MDQAVHAGNHLSESAEGHQLDDTNLSGVAHAVLVHEHLPGIHAVVLSTQRDLVLLSVEGDDIHIHGVANLADLGGVLDAAPGQLGDVDHAVHAADVHEHAVAGHGLHGAGVVLAHLDGAPHGLLSGLAGLVSDAADGAHHAAAGTVDLGNAELDLLTLHGRQISAAGLAALRSGNEHADALDGNHDAALVLLGDSAFQHGLLLNGSLNVLPDLHSVQTLLGQLGIAFHIVDADNIGLDLVAHLHDILGLRAGIVAQLAELDVSILLSANIHLNLGGGDGGDNTGYLLSCI